MHAWLGDDLEEGDAGPVVVDSAEAGKVLKHARIVFEMGVVDPKMTRLAPYVGGDGPSADQGLVKLGDLKIAGAVGVEVGLAVEFAERGDAGGDGEAEENRLAHGLFV